MPSPSHKRTEAPSLPIHEVKWLKGMEMGRSDRKWNEGLFGSLKSELLVTAVPREAQVIIVITKPVWNRPTICPKVRR